MDSFQMGKPHAQLASGRVEILTLVTTPFYHLPPLPAVCGQWLGLGPRGMMATSGSCCEEERNESLKAGAVF